MPNLISERVHEKLVKSVEIAIEANKDSMASAVVPVNIVIAKELGLTLRKEAEDALVNFPASHQVNDSFRLTDYAEALMSYTPGEYSIQKKEKRDSKPSPVSKSGDDSE